MNRMHEMKVLRIAALLVVSLIVGGAGADSAVEAGGQAHPDFARLDLDGDGYVSREEARKLGGFGRAFLAADDNRDGRLDAAEFVNARAIQERIRAGRYVDDNLITVKVKAALLKDPVVSAYAVSVETRRGTVLLSGFVESESQLRRAARIAAGVEGVIAVKNSLDVRI